MPAAILLAWLQIWVNGTVNAVSQFFTTPAGSGRGADYSVRTKMRRIVFGAMLLLVTPAIAQQPAPDPQIMIYRQLLDQANSQLASVAAQLQQAQAKIKELEDKKEKPAGPTK